MTFRPRDLGSKPGVTFSHAPSMGPAPGGGAGPGPGLSFLTGGGAGGLSASGPTWQQHPDVASAKGRKASTRGERDRPIRSLRIARVEWTEWRVSRPDPASSTVQACTRPGRAGLGRPNAARLVGKARNRDVQESGRAGMFWPRTDLRLCCLPSLAWVVGPADSGSTPGRAPRSFARRYARR